MTLCNSCNSVEGKTREIEIDGEEFTVCAECDCEEELVNVPEHDDYDMER